MAVYLYVMLSSVHCLFVCLEYVKDCVSDFEVGVLVTHRERERDLRGKCVKLMGHQKYATRILHPLFLPFLGFSFSSSQHFFDLESLA